VPNTRPPCTAVGTSSPPSGRTCRRVSAQRANAIDTNERAFAALDRYEAEGGDRQLFLWAHYFDPHAEAGHYRAIHKHRDRFLRRHLEQVGRPDLFDILKPLDIDERFEALEAACTEEELERVELAVSRSLYDAEIASADDGLQALFERLDRMGLYEDAVIVVVADHGENLEERDLHGPIAYGHARLFEPVLHVPLIVRVPGMEGRRIFALTQSIDIAPTLLDICRIEGAEVMEGRSLVPLVLGEAALHESVYSESSDNIEVCVKTDELKYIDPGPGEERLLYRWKQDQLELRDLAADSAAEAETLGELLAAFCPPARLRIRFMPSEVPASASLELVFDQCLVELREGPEDASLSEDGHRIRWSGTVGAEPIDLLVEPEHMNSRVHFYLAHDGDRPLQDRVLIGTKPLAATWAFPLYKKNSEAPPENPVLDVVHDKERHVFEFTVNVSPPLPLRMELRYALPAYENRLKLLDSVGFGKLRQRERR